MIHTEDKERVGCYLCHNTSGSNRGSFTDCHSGQYDDVPTEPAVLANIYLLSKLWAGHSVSDGRVKRVGSRIEATIGPDQRPRPYPDWTRVDERGIEVDLDSLSQEDVEPIVGGDR